MGIFDKKKDEKADFSDVQSGSSSTAPKQQPRQTERTYLVKKGDTLSDIAQRELGDASKWRQIYEANRSQIDNPDLIQPGQRLTLPSESEGGFK